MFESPEVFGKYAEIDYLLYCLKGIHERLEKRSPIEKAIDEVTGYSEDERKEVIEIIENIISLKEELDIDQTEEREQLQKIKNI